MQKHKFCCGDCTDNHLEPCERKAQNDTSVSHMFLTCKAPVDRKVCHAL